MLQVRYLALLKIDELIHETYYHDNPLFTFINTIYITLLINKNKILPSIQTYFKSKHVQVVLKHLTYLKTWRQSCINLQQAGGGPC